MKKKKTALKKKPARWWWYVCIGILCIILSFLFFTRIAAHAPITTAQQGKNIIYPTQYSDTHITENAKTTDQRFNNLAKINKENFLASAASSLQTNKPAPEASQPEKGTWLWTPPLGITPEYRDSIIAGAKKNGIRNIYLSIDSYLDIYVMPDGADKEQKKKAFDDALESFIIAAHKNNMTVDAEGGWRNWAEPGNEYKAFAVVDYVLEFNATHTEKLRGFQYDVEPYLLSSYTISKSAVLHNFVDLVSKTVTRLNNSDVEFSVVIPDFYDGTGGETPRYFYGGWNFGSTLTHLLNILERRPGSMLIVMAYRNFSQGADGSIDISHDEIQTADKYHTKVVVAQETGEVQPPYFTFYNTSLSDLNARIQDIQKAFADNASYDGIAIHYINALMALE
ncbi:MAG: hypothetical protein NTY93_03070 [Candidatus Kaiserbacteria bacterium]|nr:hypothetical protein [Candidatus Kaiserbacteria bacterium]